MRIYTKLLLTIGSICFIVRAARSQPLTAFGDNLGDGWWWMSNLKVIRDTRGKITGFEVNSGRVQHLWFRKVGT
jgi:hypothetical protein